MYVCCIIHSIYSYGCMRHENPRDNSMLLYNRDRVVNHCPSIRFALATPLTAGGRFNSPRGIAVSPNGSIYVSEHSNKRIQIFSSH